MPPEGEFDKNKIRTSGVRLFSHRFDPSPLDAARTRLEGHQEMRTSTRAAHFPTGGNRPTDGSMNSPSSFLPSGEALASSGLTVDAESNARRISAGPSTDVRRLFAVRPTDSPTENWAR